MSIGLAFWILMLLGLVFGLWQAWPNYHTFGGSIVLYILLFLLGWKVFGPPLHG